MTIGRSIGFSLWQLQHQVQQLLERRIGDLRLTLPQSAVLMQLHEEPGVSSAELARRLLLTPQALSLTIAKLETAGYLTRTAPTSGRSKALRLTEQGVAALDKAETVYSGVHREAFGALDATEQAQLKRLLDRALGAMTEHTRPGST